MDTIRNQVGRRIHDLRKERGLSQEKLASELTSVFESREITRNSVKFWETGARGIIVEHIILVAEYFGVSTDYLLCRPGVTKVKSADCTAAAKLTGLSEAAVEKLHDLFDVMTISKNSGFVSSMSEFIELESFEYILAEIMCYINADFSTIFKEIGYDGISEKKWLDSALAGCVLSMERSLSTERAKYQTANKNNMEVA